MLYLGHSDKSHSCDLDCRHRIGAIGVATAVCSAVAWLLGDLDSVVSYLVEISDSNLLGKQLCV